MIENEQSASQESSSQGREPGSPPAAENKTSPSPITPELFQEIHNLLNNAHKLALEQAGTLPEILDVIDQQIRQHQVIIQTFEQAVKPPAIDASSESEKLRQTLERNLNEAIINRMQERIEAEKQKVDRLKSLAREIVA